MHGGATHLAEGYSPKCLERLSEKSLGSLWSVAFGGAILQKQALCASFQQFVRFSAREFESFQTVSRETV
jgi:hypothetical protein